MYVYVVQLILIEVNATGTDLGTLQTLLGVIGSVSAFFGYEWVEHCMDEYAWRLLDLRYMLVSGDDSIEWSYCNLNANTLI